MSYLLPPSLPRSALMKYRKSNLQQSNYLKINSLVSKFTAFPIPQCPYSGITDAPIHALVGDGKHGHAERIQTVRGPACRPTFTARRHTPLYRLKTPSRAGS